MLQLPLVILAMSLTVATLPCRDGGDAAGDRGVERSVGGDKPALARAPRDPRIAELRTDIPPETPVPPPAVAGPPQLAESARGVIVRGPYVSIQVNVNALQNNILDDAANEPTITIDPTNPKRMAIAWWWDVSTKGWSESENPRRRTKALPGPRRTRWTEAASSGSFGQKFIR